MSREFRVAVALFFLFLGKAFCIYDDTPGIKPFVLFELYKEYRILTYRGCKLFPIYLSGPGYCRSCPCTFIDKVRSANGSGRCCYYSSFSRIPIVNVDIFRVVIFNILGLPYTL